MALTPIRVPEKTIEKLLAGDLLPTWFYTG